MEASNAASPPIKTYTLQDAVGEKRKRFTGQHLSYVSTAEHRTDAPRWMTFDLYRKMDGTYILHRVGCSAVYHSIDGCQGGERITLEKLLEITKDDGVPCRDCRPRSMVSIHDLIDAGQGHAEYVLLEHEYPTVVELATVEDIVESLKFVPRNSRDGKRVISRPGQELLYRARTYDHKIATAFDDVEDI